VILERTITAFPEIQPGEKWQSLFRFHWSAYRRWFLARGADARRIYSSSQWALQQHMPELMPVCEHLTELAGGGDIATGFLAPYRPSAYVRGCPRAVWGGLSPTLVRNDGFSPRLFERMILHTAWNGRSVISMGDCL